MSKSWTIEMWVNPDSAGDGGILISRYVQDLVTGDDGVNYEMGLAPAGVGLMRPYVRYETGNGTVVRLDGTGASDIIPAVGCDVDSHDDPRQCERFDWASFEVALPVQGFHADGRAGVGNLGGEVRECHQAGVDDS